MRSLCLVLSGAFCVGAFLVLAPGCDSGSGGLEKPPEVKKEMDPMRDMPGFKEQQDKLKKEGKIK